MDHAEGTTQKSVGQGFYISRMFFPKKGWSTHANFIICHVPKEISTLTTVRSYQSICFISMVDFSVIHLSYVYSPMVPQSPVAKVRQRHTWSK